MKGLLLDSSGHPLQAVPAALIHPSLFREDEPFRRRGFALRGLSPYTGERERWGDDRMWDESDGRHQDVLSHYARRQTEVKQRLLDTVSAAVSAMPDGPSDGRRWGSPEALAWRYESQRDSFARTERVEELRNAALEMARLGFSGWERWFEEQLAVTGAYDGLYAAYQGATTTGSALKTLLQATPGTTAARVTLFEWWISFNASAAAVPIDVDLSCDTGSITGGTSAAPTSGTTPLKLVGDWSVAGVATMQTYSAEPGSRTGAYSLWRNYVPPTSGDGRQYPAGREPQCGINGPHMFIRTTAPVAVNATTGFYMEG